jgi:hypothetical protein
MGGFSEQQRRTLLTMGTLLVGETGCNHSLERAIQAFEQWSTRLEPAARFVLRSVLTAWNLMPLFSRHLSPFATMSPDVAQQFSEGIRDPYRLMVMRIVKGLAGQAFLSEPAIAKWFGLAFAPLHAATSPPPPLARRWRCVSRRIPWRSRLSEQARPPSPPPARIGSDAPAPPPPTM